jgi:hypothetical protein
VYTCVVCGNRRFRVRSWEVMCRECRLQGAVRRLLRRCIRCGRRFPTEGDRYCPDHLRPASAGHPHTGKLGPRPGSRGPRLPDDGGPWLENAVRQWEDARE